MICSLCHWCTLYGSSNKLNARNLFKPTFSFSHWESFAIYLGLNHNFKRHLEFANLIEIMKTKGKKIFWNIKTRWISMISPIKHMLFKYHIFFMKMTLEAPIITLAKSNLCLLTNDEMLGLNVIMPLLEVVHSLIKFTQLCDMFVCDFIVVVKICEGNVYQIFVTSIPFSKLICLWILKPWSIVFLKA